MAASRFVEVTDKEIREIKINSIPKKCYVKILKQLFASGSVIIGEYSPRLRLGKYSPIITSPSANNCYKYKALCIDMHGNMNTLLNQYNTVWDT